MNSKATLICRRPCCSEENVCGIRVEKACLIFSIFNAIVVSTCLAGCLYYIGWLCDVHIRPDKHKSVDGLARYLNGIFCFALSLSTVISFAFAVLLCHGVKKKIPSFLMAYFVYGLLTEVLAAGGTIGYLVLRYDVDDVTTGVVALIICAIYIFPLILVRRTYVAFVKAKTQGPVNTTLLQ